MNLTVKKGRVRGVLNNTANYLSRHPVTAGTIIVLLSFAMLALDFAWPPYIEFSVIYALLIAAGTQFAGWQLGLGLAVLLPGVHLLIYALIAPPAFPLSTELVNAFLLFLVGIATVYLLQLAKRMEALRQENLRLETLQQTMVTVNDIVLNRLQVMQFMIHLAEQGRPLTPGQIELGRGALEEVAVKLRELSHLSQYETTEVTSGVHAVRVPDAAANGGPVAGAGSTPGVDAAANAKPA